MLVHLVIRNGLQYSIKFQIEFLYMTTECSVISEHIYKLTCYIYAMLYWISSVRTHVCIYIIEYKILFLENS